MVFIAPLLYLLCKSITIKTYHKVLLQINPHLSCKSVKAVIIKLNNNGITAVTAIVLNGTVINISSATALPQSPSTPASNNQGGNSQGGNSQR